MSIDCLEHRSGDSISTTRSAIPDFPPHDQPDSASCCHSTSQNDYNLPNMTRFNIPHGASRIHGSSDADQSFLVSRSDSSCPRLHRNSLKLHLNRASSSPRLKRQGNRNEQIQTQSRIDIQVRTQADELCVRLCRHADDDDDDDDDAIYSSGTKPCMVSLEVLERNQSNPQLDLQITMQTGIPLGQPYSPKIQFGSDTRDVSAMVQNNEDHSDVVHDSASFCFRVVLMVRETLMQALSSVHNNGKDGGIEMIVVRLLQTLQHLEMSLDVLKETQIGKCVNKLRKHPNKDIAAHAKQLVRTWKQLIDAYLQSKTSCQFSRNIKNSCDGDRNDHGRRAKHDHVSTKRRRVC